MNLSGALFFLGSVVSIFAFSMFEVAHAHTDQRPSRLLRSVLRSALLAGLLVFVGGLVGHSTVERLVLWIVIGALFGAFLRMSVWWRNWPLRAIEAAEAERALELQRIRHPKDFSA